MGFLAQDVVPFQVTAITPVNKDVVVKAFQVLRTDTVASVKMVLPADASILDVVIYGAASNAATTATLSVGTTVAATEIVNGQDVKTAGGQIRPTSSFSPNFPNREPRPLTGDINVWAKYAETGAASSSGGPYTVVVYYVR